VQGSQLQTETPAEDLTPPPPQRRGPRCPRARALTIPAEALLGEPWGSHKRRSEPLVVRFSRHVRRGPAAGFYGRTKFRRAIFDVDALSRSGK